MRIADSVRGSALGASFCPLPTAHRPLRTAYRRPPTADSRRGISLLEVLISILVLSVGLLGTLSLVPLGHHDIVEASKMDRGGTLGRLAFRDIIIRGYLRPDMWCDQNGGTTMLWKDSSGNPTPADAFVIDPLLCGYAKSSNLSFPSTIPYDTKTYGAAHARRSRGSQSGRRTIQRKHPERGRR